MPDTPPYPTTSAGAPTSLAAPLLISPRSPDQTAHNVHLNQRRYPRSLTNSSQTYTGLSTPIVSTPSSSAPYSNSSFFSSNYNNNNNNSLWSYVVNNKNFLLMTFCMVVLVCGLVTMILILYARTNLSHLHLIPLSDYNELRSKYDRLDSVFKDSMELASKYLDLPAYTQYSISVHRLLEASEIGLNTNSSSSSNFPIQVCLQTTCPDPVCPTTDTFCPVTVCPSCSQASTSCPGLSDHTINLISGYDKDDLSTKSTIDASSFLNVWERCEDTKYVDIPYLGDVELCDEADFRMEQYYEKEQFRIPNSDGDLITKARAPRCIQSPPPAYKFPTKYAPVPAIENTSAIHWPNHRVYSVQNLSMFNEGYTKNLYHFDAPLYDREQEAKINLAAKYIPFKQRIRVGLDIGAGGGSLGVIMKRRYDVQVLSLAFAEYPYCEYMSERGTLCAYINAFWSMPFGKYSFDFVHSAWLFHMDSGPSFVERLMELNRIIRPGGYLWWEGGFSYSQRDTVLSWAKSLGYTIVWQEQIDKVSATMFRNEPHQVDWTVILIKPTSTKIISCSRPTNNSTA